MDGASPSVGEEEFEGVGIHIELVVWGDDFESIVDDVLAEDGGPSFFIGVAEPAESRVNAWHWAARCWCAHLFTVLIFQD